MVFALTSGRVTLLGDFQRKWAHPLDDFSYFWNWPILGWNINFILNNQSEAKLTLVLIKSIKNSIVMMFLEKIKLNWALKVKKNHKIPPEGVPPAKRGTPWPETLYGTLPVMEEIQRVRNRESVFDSCRLWRLWVKDFRKRFLWESGSFWVFETLRKVLCELCNITGLARCKQCWVNYSTLFDCTVWFRC